jgi:outer membrane immunogenic protein
MDGARARISATASGPTEAGEELETTMKKFLLGLAGLVALAAPASAADMAVAPYKAPPPMIAAIYDWSGFYVGINGGWGSSRKCWDNYVGTVLIASEGCHDATGGVFGGQVGYRVQTGAFVFGVEGQGDWSDLRGRNASLITPANTDESRIAAFGLLTGQIGYAWNNVLLYAKGGAAITDDRFRILTTGTNLLIATSKDTTRWGGVVGVGLEYGFSPNWSAAIEYDHLFMDRRDAYFVFAGTANPFQTDRIKQDVDLVTVRVNYRWGGPVIAKY